MTIAKSMLRLKEQKNNLEFFVCDNGNETIKALDKDYNRVHYLNVIAEVDDSEANLHIKKNESMRRGRAASDIYADPYNCLDVTIYKNNEKLGRFYLGNLAIKFFDSSADRRDDSIPKSKDLQTYICNYTSIAMLLINRNANTDHIKKDNVGLAALLPMGEFLNYDLYNHMYDELLGDIKVQFHRGILKNKVVEYSLVEDNVQVFPESGIGLTGLYYDENGNEDEEFSEKTKDQYLVGLDIGSINTNLTVMYNKTLQEKYSIPMQGGIQPSLNNIISILSEDIREKYNKEIECTPDELMYYIKDQNCKYPFARSSIDIKDMVSIILKRDIKSLLRKFNNRIPDFFDFRIYGLYLHGGGSILMNKLIKEHLGHRFLIKNVEDKLFFNAISAMKCMKATFR